MKPEMDELKEVPVHRWFSSARALMVCEPYYGCVHALVCLGRFTPYSLGWNRSQTGLAGQDAVKFIYVGPDGGQTVLNAPPVGAPIHRERFPDPNDLDLLWQIHCDMGAKVAELRLHDLDSQRIHEVRRSIDSFRKKNPADHGARDAALRARLLAARPDLLRLWDRGFPGIEDVRNYPVVLVEDYLDFRVPGYVAAELLGIVIAMIADAPRFSHFLMDSECTRASIMHLADLAYNLLQRRKRYNVGGYYTLTYLAGLYASAARSVAARARDAAELEKNDLSQIVLMGNNADELFAHHVGPAFMLPSLFDPKGMLEFLQHWAAAGKGTPEEKVAHFSPPPAYLRLLDTATTPDEPQVLEHIREAENTLDRLDVNVLIRQEAHPVPQTIADRLMAARRG